jgi:hypothetical protein
MPGRLVPPAASRSRLAAPDVTSPTLLPGTAAPSGGRRPAPVAVAAALLLILAAALALRIPLLANADYTFNSDEAVNALVLQHMLHHGDLALFNWDVHYYGVVEELLSLPFLAAGAAIPLAAKLGSLLGFVLLEISIFWLGSRLRLAGSAGKDRSAGDGAAMGLLAAAILGAFSPQLLQWSTFASVGYALIVAWGTFTLIQYDRVRARPSHCNIVALGFVAGFGLYVYELYLVYLAALGAAWLASCWPLSYALAGSAGARRDLRAAFGRRLAHAALFLAGFSLGWAPHLALLLSRQPEAGKQAAYTLAPPAVMLANLKLLLGHCAPTLLGVNWTGNPKLADLVGRAWPLSRALGIALLLFYTAAWAAGAWRVWRPLAASVAQARTLTPLTTEAVVVLLVPVTALLFVLSPNAQGELSNHYLLPMLSSLPLLAAALLIRMGRRTPAAAWALAALLVVFPIAQIGRWYKTSVQFRFLGPGLTLRIHGEPLEQVAGFLARQGISAAYADYWVAFKTTALAGERIVVTPLQEWDRYPPYTRRVDAAPREAYIFVDPGEAAAGGFPARLQAAGAPWSLTRIDHYLVYWSPLHRRLLPPPASVKPLVAPRAELAARPPAVWAAGIEAAVPVVVRNAGAAGWSSLGSLSQGGSFRVALTYRWFDAAGHLVIAEGKRTLLPYDLPPGASARVAQQIVAPQKAGRYRLRLTLVQENVAWFDEMGAGAANYPVEITAAPR